MDVRFDSILVNNTEYARQNWFSGKTELNDLFQKMDSGAGLSNSTPFYWGYRTVTVISTSVFRVSLFYIFKSFALILKKLYFNSTSLRLRVFSLILTRPIFEVYNKIYWREKLLVSTFNSYSHEAKWLTLIENYPFEKVKNPVLRKHLRTKSEIRFNLSDEGLCHGAVCWFNFLNLKIFSSNSFGEKKISFEKVLTSVATRFEDGQPFQVGVIQSLFEVSDYLLNTYSEIKSIATLSNSEGYEKVCPETKFLNGLKKLEVGFYELMFYNDHAVSLIVGPTNSFYVFDPNIGLLKFEDINDVYKYVFKPYFKGLIDRKTSLRRQFLKKKLTMN